MKYLTDTFGIEEYKAPNTELAPIEYDFEAPMDFDADDSNFYPGDSSEEEASNDYTDNSDFEYLDYFDYYHSKNMDLDTNETKAKEVVEDFKETLKDAGNNLLDTTKDKVNTIVTAVAELEPIKAKPKQEVHIIDDQFSGAIDVFSASKEVQGATNVPKFKRYNSSSNGTSLGGIIK